MSPFSLKLPALAAALAGALAGPAHASVPLLSEGFDDPSTLQASGWVRTNASSSAGLHDGWFRGDDTLFPAQAGAPRSYLGADFSSAGAGATLDDWLISPSFSTAAAGVVSVWVRGAGDAGYADHLKFGFSDGAATPAAFTTGSSVTVAGDWSRYTFAFAAAGTGSVARFAIDYTGLADTSNYVGVDSFSVSAVPEPASALLLASGLAGVAGLARARRRAMR